MTRIGFVGTGAMTSAMVTGLGSGYDMLVSPRNPTIARGLADRFANVSVASSNQAVLDASDVVVLAVRPGVAAEVMAALRFQSDHRVISVINRLSVARLAAVVAPATLIVRAVPLPTVAERAGVTPIYPPHPFAAELFDAIGIAISVGTEAAFDAFCAATGTIASFYAFTDSIASWLSRHGIPTHEAREYTARMISGLDLRSSAAAHATPGGINERFLHHLVERGVFDSISSGLDAVL